MSTVLQNKFYPTTRLVKIYFVEEKKALSLQFKKKKNLELTLLSKINQVISIVIGLKVISND